MPQTHHTALLGDGRCPECAESLTARALFGRGVCTRCGAEPRAYGTSDAAARFEGRVRRTTWVVAVVAGVAQLLIGWIPLADVVIALGIALWIRLAILRPAVAMMSPGRRLVTRGTARVLVGALLAALLVVSQLVTFLGPLGLPVKAVLGAAEVGLAALLVTRYVASQVERETAGKPIEAAEIGLLIVMVVLLLGAAFAATFAVVSALGVIQEFFGGLP